MSIIAIPTDIPDLFIIESKVFRDNRGWFFESFNKKEFSIAVERQITFVQDNHSFSKKGVLRGLHYQIEQTQGKLVSVCRGCVFDVAVDLRQSSMTFGQWFGSELSAENKRSHWIPAGFAHGFLVLSDEAEFLYKTTDYWHPSSEQCIAWNDPSLNIQWPQIGLDPILNPKDQQGLSWNQAPKFD
jgi:dTDP-4-dehydrorhamnose 3,5-epimerase